ncbi:bifunctional 3-(3-hydroxy-phenyl)propionate/3-hydroxycinnamic acid hydroxylase [Acinetobacter baumannii]|uniref:bifunctional 3-(3-hydroxy-phenyl)propionate/3-hydroxycinnamic acid hydroxylase n=1 Tax=Acinetobacter baumannii TaxID=470 RepID=UPI003AF5E590
MEHDQKTEVLIIGAGPVGLLLANFLGAYGVKTLVLEKNATYEIEPRAVSIDDESLRSLQFIQLAEPFMQQIVMGYGVQYYDWQNKPLAEIKPNTQDYGYPKRNAFRQPDLVKLLVDNLKNYDSVKLLFQHQLLSIDQNDDQVVCQVQTGEQQSIQIQSAWMVGCDGGRSMTRDLINAKLEGKTFPQRWLIVDLAERKCSLRHTQTFCDPIRPAIRLPGPNRTLRYEFMLHANDDDEYVLEESVFRDWISQRMPADADLPLIRKAVYSFHARTASIWQKNRVLLAGDAAHLTPPFAGQGLNSGIRDVTNLAWKLAAVLKWDLPNSLINTYEIERKPHAAALIKMALKIGTFMQPKSKWSAFWMQNTLRAACLISPVKDYILQLKFKPKPHFSEGWFIAKKHHEQAELIPQPYVQDQSGKVTLLDDYLGQNFAVIGWERGSFCLDIKKFIPPNVPVTYIALLSQDEDFIEQDIDENFILLRDCHGVIEKIFKQHQAVAMIIRPDRYSYNMLTEKELHASIVDAQYFNTAFA